MKTIDLIFKEEPEYIQPEDYLRAAGESLFLMLVIGAIISLIFIPEVYISNPILERMGYNNFCVGFDMAPATYFALPFGILAVYFSMQFNIYDRLRTKLVEHRIPNWKRNFSIVTNNIYLVSITSLPIMLLVSPMVSVWIHTLLFLQIISFRALLVLANFFEHPNPNFKYKLYVYIYLIVSISLTSFAFINYINFDNSVANGLLDIKPVIPVYIAQSFDYLWFFLVIMGTFLVESGEKIYVKYK